MKLFPTIILLIATTNTVRVATAQIDYATQIRPLLSAKCYSCHGVLKQEGGLRLDTASLMIKGGDSGASIQPENSQTSLLVHRITADKDSRMPPAEDGAALTAQQIQLVRQWIDEGANAPLEEPPSAPRDHWAFQTIQQPALPTGSKTQNPIDALLMAKHKELGLKTQPPAQPSLLIRRLYLNLIGLPPTQTQLHDQRPWNEIVDELLANPHHGERWGRHWMDVWRYSEWYGLGAQLRYSQKHIWHWRDWIINSLNRDKGYDRMIHEMLAGDEIAPEDPQVLAATGFLARNYYLFNRTTWLDSTIEHTSKAFLGLTLNCAKCHDHKYDPITHEDYYSFRAIFEPHQVRLDPVPGVTNLENDGLPRAFDDHLDAETWLHLKGDPMKPDKDLQINPRVPSLFTSFQPPIKAIELPPAAFAPGTRDYVQQDHLQQAEDRIKTAKNELKLAVHKQAIAATTVTIPQEPDAKNFNLRDDFDAPNPKLWEVVGADWKYENGTLQRSTSTRGREFVRLRKPLPQNFEIRCRYTTTGGDTYKSVTFRFDESGDGRYANYVYTSAHAPGPKVQVAYVRDNVSSYPRDGQKAYPVKVGDSLELQFAVRDRLVNVWLNDEFQLAYLLPDRQPGGQFSMHGFDATVAFDCIEIRTLPDDVALRPAKTAPAETIQDAETQVKIATAKLAAAEAWLVSVKATLAADKAQVESAGQNKSTDNSAAKSFAQLAAIAQAETLLAESKHELLSAAGDANKTKAATEKQKQAEAMLVDAREGKTSYSPLRASRKALEGPADKEPDYPAIYATTSTGRRSALAKWITSGQNPLAARVAVNHVWMRHFGEPLVESVFDFGLRAPKPLHADLLDFLAADFMQHNWSFKHLHRLIVTSETYQRSSSLKDADSATAATDPDNKYYWRMNTRRMESQVVRDSLLHLAGELNLHLGGPSVDTDNATSRRALYYKHSRDSQNKFLSMFDDADLLQCYRRSESIVPQQALALANSEVSMQNAEKIAAKIAAAISLAPQSDDQARFISTAIETLLGRQPVDHEERLCMEFCNQLTELLKNDASFENTTALQARVRTRLIHSLLNHNDFISIR